MKVPKIDVHDTTLSQLLTDMGSGKLQVPRFQRGFVWPLTKTRKLLDSIYKEFPIGTFFLWRAPAGSPALSRPLTELGLPKPPTGSEVVYILDGQQRLTSLYAVINRYKKGQRNYGRVCIDLETATRFDANHEEGFSEDIYVYRTGDGKRFIPVADLVGPSNLEVYDSVPKEWKPAFNKAHQLLQVYPFSVVWIQGQDLGSAIEIFQRINEAGKPLSRYDLVCANVWTEEFDLRKRIELQNKMFAARGFGELHETVWTQALALMISGRCTTVAELSLKSEEVEKNWNAAVRAIELAVDFAATNLGVKRANYLPYRGIIAVLAAYFHNTGSSALSAAERAALWSWFWKVSLSERYGSTSPSRMAEDAAELGKLASGGEPVFAYGADISPDAVLRTKMTTSSSALRNATLCMLALLGPRSLKDGGPVDLTNSFFASHKKAERHHVFPIGYLQETGISTASVHVLPNFCFLPADLNKEISKKAPGSYLSEYRASNPGFDAAAESHLIPVEEDSPIWENDFGKFLRARAERIAGMLNAMPGTAPDTFIGPLRKPTPETAHAPILDAVEIGLRDLIDSRLTSLVGDNYWKLAIPNSVASKVDVLVTGHLTRHPYDDQGQHSLGRRRLDFCDVSHYKRIILENWDAFSTVFGKKAEFERHMEAFRQLRNSLKHNREPTDVEQGAGNAAMSWLEHCLRQAERQVDAQEEDLETENVEA